MNSLDHEIGAQDDRSTVIRDRLLISQMLDALRFYAHPENHKQLYIPSRGFSVSEVAIDNGERARAVLASVDHQQQLPDDRPGGTSDDTLS